MKRLWKFINSAYDEIYFIDDNIHKWNPYYLQGFLEQFPDSACYKLIKNIVKNELNKMAL